jgi:hypothetical protein
VAAQGTVKSAAVAELPMSALPPKADIGTQSWNVRFVPKAHSCVQQKCDIAPYI